MKIEKLVEVIDIWVPTKKDGEAFCYSTGEKLKLVATFANGKPIFLENKMRMQKRYIPKEVIKYC